MVLGLHVNAHKTEYMCYNQTGDISTLEGTPLKLVDKFTYLGSSVESTEKDIETRLTKAWTAINRLSTIWKSDLTDKMKRSFFQAAVTSILLYGCTTWTLTKRLEKKLDGNYTRMLRAILNKSWQRHPTRHQLYGHLPPITKSIQVRRTRHAGHCWRSRDELIRDVLLWIPTHGRAKAGRPARTYIQQLCEDTGCCPEDLPRAMNDREEWRERVRDIRAASTIWWWWWNYILGKCIDGYKFTKTSEKIHHGRHQALCKKCKRVHPAGAVEYTNCISAEGVIPHNGRPGYDTNGRPGYDIMGVLDMTLNNLMVWLQPWSFGKWRVLLYCHFYQVHSVLKW